MGLKEQDEEFGVSLGGTTIIHDVPIHMYKKLFMAIYHLEKFRLETTIYVRIKCYSESVL